MDAEIKKKSNLKYLNKNSSSEHEPAKAAPV
jgi:hypothetical protein